MNEIEELLKQLSGAEHPVTQEELKKAMETIDAKIESLSMQKAYNRDGVGHKGNALDTNERETDPAAYIVKKAQSPNEMDATDKALAWGIMYKAISEGMNY